MMMMCSIVGCGKPDFCPGLFMMKVGDEGDEYNIADYAGRCHPSAELQAIYNEEIMNV